MNDEILAFLHGSSRGDSRKKDTSHSLPVSPSQKIDQRKTPARGSVVSSVYAPEPKLFKQHVLLFEQHDCHGTHT